jgi:PAS domain S-box-containing protein
MNKSATANLQHQIKYLSDILNLVPSYLFWKDMNSVFLGCNILFAKSANLTSPADIVGKTDYDLPWAKDESDKYRADDQAVIATGKSRMNTEEAQTLADGSQIVLLTSKVPLYDGDKIVGVIGMYQDITHLKQAKQQADIANQLKTEFMLNLQHDMRTPITGIRLLLSSLLKTGTWEKCERLLPLAIKATNEVLDVCDELIDFECLAQEDKPVLNKSLNLATMLVSIHDLYMPIAINKGLRLMLNKDERVPDCFIGDEY